MTIVRIKVTIECIKAGCDQPMTKLERVKFRSERTKVG